MWYNTLNNAIADWSLVKQWTESMQNQIKKRGGLTKLIHTGCQKAFNILEKNVHVNKWSYS